MADEIKDILGEYGADPFTPSPVPPSGKSSNYKPSQTPAALGAEMMDAWAKPFPSWSQMATDAYHGAENALAGDRSGKTVADLMNVWLGSVPAAMYGIPRGAIGSGPARAPSAAPSAPARKLDKLGFYSKAVEEAERLPIGKKGWSGDQVLAGLKKAGVKPEEVKWMDLEKALKEKPIWTKDEVVALANDRRVKPQRHALDEESGTSDDALRDMAWGDALDRARENIQIKPDEDMVQARESELLVEKAEDGTYRVVDDTLRSDEPDHPSVVVSEGHKTENDAHRAIQKHAEEWAEEFPAIYDGDHKLAGYDEVGDQLARATSQRARDRILSEYINSAAEREMDDFDPAQYRRDIGENQGAQYKGYLDTRPGGEDAGRDYTELLYTVPGTTLSRKGIPDFTASHWDEPNIAGSILAHYYNDAATGKDVLFANELQSDWGQKLRKYGEKKSGSELAALEDAHRRAEMQKEILKDRYYEVSTGEPGYPPFETYYTGGYEPTVEKVRDLDRALAHLSRARGVAQEGRLPPDRYGGATWPEAIANAEANVASAQAALRDAGVPLVAKDDPNFLQWQREYGDADLRATEAKNAYDSARRGISPGPFVGSTSDFTRFLGKNALTEAANSGAGYFAWSPADIVTGRWGEHLRPFYEKQVPETMLKLAREHDPDAALTKVHIGDYEGDPTPRVAYDYNPQRGPQLSNEASTALAAMSDPTPEKVWPIMPQGYQGELFPTTWGNLGQGYGRGRLTMGWRPDEVVYAPHTNTGSRADPQLNYPLTGDQAKRIGRDYSPDEIAPVYQLGASGRTGGGAGYFRTREAAEQALAEIQRKWAEAEWGRPDLAQMQKDYDLTEVPAIAITDKMRQSIKSKGFPLFVNPPQSSIPSFLSNPSPTTAPQLLDREYGDRPYDPRFDT